MKRYCRLTVPRASHRPGRIGMDNAVAGGEDLPGAPLGNAQQIGVIHGRCRTREPRAHRYGSHAAKAAVEQQQNVLGRDHRTGLAQLFHIDIVGKADAVLRNQIAALASGWPGLGNAVTGKKEEQAVVGYRNIPNRSLYR